MFERTLRRRCESIVRDIRIPRPFSARALCEDLAARSSRKIYLHPYAPDLAGEGMPCGVWVATTAADHIFFEQQTSRYHQDHIILHELGHMLCRHTLEEVAGTVLDADENVHSDQVRGALMRTSYTTRQEREAELVATMILERAMAWDGDAAAAQERYFGEVLGFL